MDLEEGAGDAVVQLLFGEEREEALRSECHDARGLPILDQQGWRSRSRAKESSKSVSGIKQYSFASQPQRI